MKINITLNNQVMETILKNSRNDTLGIARELGIDEISANNYDRAWYMLRKKQEAKDASPKGEVIYKNDGENYVLDINVEDKYLVKTIELGFTIAKRILPLANMIKAAWAFAQNIGTLIKKDIKEFESEFTVPEYIKKYQVLKHEIGDRVAAFTFVDDGYNKRFYSVNYNGDPVPGDVLDYVLDELGGQKFAEDLNYSLTKREADQKVRKILDRDEK